MPQRDKVRVYILARELDIDTADLLRLCEQAGFDVKNQLSSLDSDQQHKLEEMVKKTSKSAAPVVPAKPVTKVVPPDERVVPTIPSRPLKREVEPVRVPTAVEEPTPAVVVEPSAPEPAVETPTVAEVQEPTAKTGASNAPQMKAHMPNLSGRSSPKAAPTPVAKSEPIAPPAKPENPPSAPVPAAPPAPTITTTPSRPTSPIPSKMPSDLGKTTVAKDAPAQKR